MAKKGTYSDRYTKARGGTSTLFTLYCGICRAELLLYQKDGAGDLFRLYVDRIRKPDSLVQTYSKAETKKDLTALKCPACNQTIGMPMVYEKENRLALRLVGSIAKVKNPQGIYPLGQQGEK